ncbi:MAG: hypothetical protein JXR78_06655 [Victivallales bacterium]|nr:hypothetical protein [Victivallales bacterium]
MYSYLTAVSSGISVRKTPALVNQYLYLIVKDLSPVSIFSNYLPEKNPFFQDNILFERVPEAVTLTNGIIGELATGYAGLQLNCKRVPVSHGRKSRKTEITF